MGKTTNTYVWFDLNTTDKAGAKAFYTELLGWTIEDREMGEAGTYTSLQNGERGFGGMEEARGGAPAAWVGYVDVDDLGARVARLKALGANAMMDGMDIPGVGRVAMLADPSGAVFALYQAARDSGDWEPSTTGLGDIGWQEVSSNDLQGSKGFYGEGFGWVAGDPMQTPGGDYHMFMQGEKPIAGLYQRPSEVPFCAWTFYINVADVDTTVAKAKELGGQLLHGATIEGMVQFAVLQDPQGACFGIAKDLKTAG